jgi:hypothetical protein
MNSTSLQCRQNEGERQGSITNVNAVQLNLNEFLAFNPSLTENCVS